MSVWSSLVGQRHVVATLAEAVAGKGMTHAWLFTGPPGSGRSNAAIAFAAALQCEAGGCGACEACRTSLAGSHPDVKLVTTDFTQLKVDVARDLVMAAALRPTKSRWQIIIVEDADRLNMFAGNALLKAIEEPGARTVWILCAPHAEDVLPTIRSRSRHVNLSTPTAAEVAGFLTDRFDVPEALAAHAARASQGHIGRARALALEEDTRTRRREVVRLPGRLVDLGSTLNAAANLVDLAGEEAEQQTRATHERDLRDLEVLYGDDRKAKSSRSYRAALAELEKNQKARARRAVLDGVDRALMDLLSVYRDVILLQTNAGAALVNEEERPDLVELARRTTPEDNLRRIDAVYAAREQMMDFNTPPLLALESMMVALSLDPTR